MAFQKTKLWRAEDLEQTLGSFNVESPHAAVVHAQDRQKVTSEDARSRLRALARTRSERRAPAAMSTGAPATKVAHSASPPPQAGTGDPASMRTSRTPASRTPASRTLASRTPASRTLASRTLGPVTEDPLTSTPLTDSGTRPCLHAQDTVGRFPEQNPMLAKTVFMKDLPTVVMPAETWLGHSTQAPATPLADPPEEAPVDVAGLVRPTGRGLASLRRRAWLWPILGVLIATWYVVDLDRIRSEVRPPPQGSTPPPEHPPAPSHSLASQGATKPGDGRPDPPVAVEGAPRSPPYATSDEGAGLSKASDHATTIAGPVTDPQAKRRVGPRSPTPKAAVDALLRGQWSEALMTYRALAKQDPSQPAYAEAVRILSRRTPPPMGAQLAR